MMETAVELRGLSKSYGSVRALSDLDLAVAAGGLVSIVGPDGAGKTTLVKIMTGILEPDFGTARVFGFDTVRQFDAVKKNIGYLSQNFTLYGDLSVDENIEFFAEIHRVRAFRQRRDDLLAFTGLAPFRKRLADRLSGGMKQKLALACTLIHSPRVIFLDEPTTGVDPVSRREFWIILADLIRSGITVIMTTPYMDEAERSDRVALLFEGRLLFSDTPAGLRSRFPKDVVEIVATDTRLAARALSSSAFARDVELFGDRLHVLLAKGRGVREKLMTILKQAGVGVESVRAKSPSLENVFISLIKDKAALRLRSEQAPTQKAERKTKGRTIREKDDERRISNSKFEHDKGNVPS